MLHQLVSIVNYNMILGDESMDWESEQDVDVEADEDNICDFIGAEEEVRIIKLHKIAEQNNIQLYIYFF